MPVSGNRKKRIPPFHISRKGAEAQRKAGKPACRAFTLRLCAFARFRGDMFFLSALKRIGSDMRGQKSGQRKLANLDGLELNQYPPRLGHGQKIRSELLFQNNPVLKPAPVIFLSRLLFCPETKCRYSLGHSVCSRQVSFCRNRFCRSQDRRFCLRSICFHLHI